MFDKFTNKLAEKMGQSVKKAAEPIKEQVTNKVDSKVDLYSKILRLGVLLFLFIDGTKRVSNALSDSKDSPSHIVINNYLYDVKRKEDDI